MGRRAAVRRAASGHLALSRAHHQRVRTPRDRRRPHVGLKHPPVDFRQAQRIKYLEEAVAAIAAKTGCLVHRARRNSGRLRAQKDPKDKSSPCATRSFAKLSAGKTRQIDPLNRRLVLIDAGGAAQDRREDDDRRRGKQGFSFFSSESSTTRPWNRRVEVAITVSPFSAFS